MKHTPRSPPRHLREHKPVINKTQSLPMAITLNKLAVRCLEIALAGGKITSTSSAQTLLYDISRNWRDLLEATNFNSQTLSQWSEKEEAAAEVMITVLTYLQRIGCKNIEQLLKDSIEQHARQNE